MIKQIWSILDLICLSLEIVQYLQWVAAQNFDDEKVFSDNLCSSWLGIIAQVYEAGTCRDRVERLKLTGIEAENEYKKCISF